MVYFVGCTHKFVCVCVNMSSEHKHKHITCCSVFQRSHNAQLCSGFLWGVFYVCALHIPVIWIFQMVTLFDVFLWFDVISNSVCRIESSKVTVQCAHCTVYTQAQANYSACTLIYYSSDITEDLPQEQKIQWKCHAFQPMGNQFPN